MSMKEKTRERDYSGRDAHCRCAPAGVSGVHPADELTRWFAEHAHISQAEGHYDFWGDLTPESPTPDQGQHRLLSWEADRSLAFVWSVRGARNHRLSRWKPKGK